MKKAICIIVWILLVLWADICFGGIFDAFYKKSDTKIDSKTENKITTTIDKQTKDIKAGLNDIKAGVNENKVDLKALNEAMFDLKAEVTAEIEAKMIDLSKTLTAGGDLMYNDPTILKYFISMLGMIILVLIRGNFAERKHRRNVEKRKDEWKNKMLEILIKEREK